MFQRFFRQVVFMSGFMQDTGLRAFGASSSLCIRFKEDSSGDIWYSMRLAAAVFFDRGA